MKRRARKVISILCCLALSFLFCSTAYAQKAEAQAPAFVGIQEQASASLSADASGSLSGAPQPSESANPSAETSASSGQSVSASPGPSLSLSGRTEESTGSLPAPSPDESASVPAITPQPSAGGQPMSALDSSTQVIKKNHVQYVEGQLLVSFKSHIPLQNVKDTLAKSKRGEDGLALQSKFILNVLKIVDGISVDQAVEKLLKNPDVEYVQPNYLYPLMDEE